MIQDFVDAYLASQDKVEERFRAAHPQKYKDIVRMVIETLKKEWDSPDPAKITECTTGGYQGALLFVIAGEEYSGDFWTVKINYGSCSGCDTLEGIHQYEDEAPTDQQVADYMSLALHVIQGLRKV